jgi:hypothetical protein
MPFSRVLVSSYWACWLVLGAVSSAVTQDLPGPPQLLPDSIPLSELEIRLERHTGGGCIGRCVHYRVTVRGDGMVIYEDLAQPPVPSRQRTVAVDDVVSLANEFVRSRFFEAPERYVGESFYERQGEQLRLRGTAASDGPAWDLSIRLGRLAKSVHLYLAYPEALARLRDRVDRIGGPQSWTDR